MIQRRNDDLIAKFGTLFRSEATMFRILLARIGRGDRNRTGVHGFAGSCILFLNNGLREISRPKPLPGTWLLRNHSCHRFPHRTRRDRHIDPRPAATDDPKRR